MSNVNKNAIQAAKPNETQADAVQGYVGHDHQDLDDDFAALKSIMGIPDFSGVKRLKNSFSALKSLFSQ